MSGLHTLRALLRHCLDDGRIGNASRGRRGGGNRWKSAVEIRLGGSWRSGGGNLNWVGGTRHGGNWKSGVESLSRGAESWSDGSWNWAAGTRLGESWK